MISCPRGQVRSSATLVLNRALSGRRYNLLYMLCDLQSIFVRDLYGREGPRSKGGPGSASLTDVVSNSPLLAMPVRGPGRLLRVRASLPALMIIGARQY